MVFSYDNYYERHLLQKKKKRDCIYPLGPFCPLVNLLKDAFNAANVNIELNILQLCLDHFRVEKLTISVIFY